MDEQLNSSAQGQPQSYLGGEVPHTSSQWNQSLFNSPEQVENRVDNS